MHLIFPLALVILFIVNACSNDESIEELHQYVAQVSKEPAPSELPAVLKEIPPLPNDTKQVDRDPFQEQLVMASQPSKQTGTPGAPLTRFPLQELKLVGFVRLGNTTWAVIETPEGEVHRAGIGTPIGQKEGKVIKIHPDKIEVSENRVGELGNIVKQTVYLNLEQGAANPTK